MNRNVLFSGRSLIGIIIALISFGVARYGFPQLFGGDIESQLRKASAELNKQLPKAIDGDVRLDTTKAGPGKRISYHYTYVNVAKKDVKTPIEQLKNLQRSSLIQEYRSAPALKNFRESGVFVEHQYSDKNGEKLFDVAVGPTDLK